jgi:hypothetical protein
MRREQRKVSHVVLLFAEVAYQCSAELEIIRYETEKKFCSETDCFKD